MFELVIGAMIARAGLIPQLGQEPDVIFDFVGRQIFVECKRVFSEKKIEERIRKAARQLKTHIKSESHCGLIAVSVSRTINSGDVIWSVTSVADASRLLESKIFEIIHRLDPFLQELSHPAISGVVFYITSPVHITGIGFSPVKRGRMYPMPGAVDLDFLKRLTRLLRL